MKATIDLWNGQDQVFLTVESCDQRLGFHVNIDQKHFFTLTPFFARQLAQILVQAAEELERKEAQALASKASR